LTWMIVFMLSQLRARPRPRNQYLLGGVQQYQRKQDSDTKRP